MNGVALGLLAALLRTTVFLGGAAVAVRLVLNMGRPASPTLHRATWLLVLLTGWFWWRLPVTIPYEEPPRPPAPASVAEEQLPALPWAAAEHEPLGQVVAPAAASPARQPPADSWLAVAVRATLPLVLLAVWLLGLMVVVTLWITRYLVSLRRLRAAGAAEEAWLAQWDDLCRASGVRKAIPLRVTESAGPLLCRTPSGYLLVVPRVLWRQLTPAERLSILQHELAHWKRRDLLKSTAIRLMTLPHWFNPLAWLAANWFDEAAEWACDEAARGKTAAGRQAYAKALLQLQSVLGPRLAYHAAASGRGLSARVERLLRPQTEKDSLMKKIVILAVALGLALLCLVRLELVAKEPAEKAEAASAMPQGLVIDFAATLGNKLTEGQRLYCQWDAERFGLPDQKQWQKLDSQQRAAKEEELIKQLDSEQESERVKAIDGLVALNSHKAIPGIIKIAADRKEKNNRDRHTATRALAMLGDRSAVPELVSLTYHYNWNVRQWAQIALVRFSGQNFGHDVATWRGWWEKQGGKPPIPAEPVKWATSSEMLKYADLKLQDERDKQWVASHKERLSAQMPGDAKLTAIQQAMRNLSEQELSRSLSPSAWQDLPPKEKAAEEDRWIKQLSQPSESARVLAIYALTAMKSRKAVPALLAIATERKEKDNRDRWMACRALGVVGDQSIVPQLVPLTYHYNRDTRLWAQISLVPLTGENFGRDVAAWRTWWEKRGGKPPIPAEPVQWATSPQTLAYASPQAMDQADQLLQRGGYGGGYPGYGGRPTQPMGNPPRIASSSPADGAKEIDPATTQVTITFDQDMGDGITLNGEGVGFPFLPGANAYWRDPRTFVLSVKLEAGRSYRIGLNLFSPNYQSFKSVQGVALMPTTICFTTRGTPKPAKAEADKTPPKPAAVSPGFSGVVEGIGWGSFRVGATRDELIKAYGEPDPNPGNPWMRWPSHHVDCICPPDGRVAEVRFNEGFTLPLTSGVKIGSPEKDVLTAYGAPDRVLLQSQAKMLTFNRGILMWVMDGKVYSFTAFRKEAVGQPTNGFGVAGRAGQQGHHGGQPTSGIIGAALKRQDDHYVVLGVFPGSPAAAAGLKEGDQLLQVDGQAVKADFEEIAKRIGGPAGTVVKLKVRKADGNEVELAITRRELPYP